MGEPNEYERNLHLIRSLLISTTLQQRRDVRAQELIERFEEALEWEPLSELMIDAEVWKYILTQGIDPKKVFCHPRVLQKYPVTSLYYRGLAALPIKTAKAYVGTIENLETGRHRVSLSNTRALKIARTYNTFICSNIKGSANWTLENGYRTIIATLGITLDGTIRNRIGDIAERRMRTLILEWLYRHNLILDPNINLPQEFDLEELPRSFTLRDGVVMEFGSEPDISFRRGSELLAVIEIKGGTDPAGALERYGAATKSFRQAVSISPRCKNFYLVAARTDELERRIKEDRLVERTFHIVHILKDTATRESFFREIFHYVLRLA
ncbi:MAG: XcyI family restriction endonuclease [Anaerolineae bacterium]